MIEARRLDGNAIGGELMELFGAELTVAIAVCRSCGARRAGGGDARVPRRARHRRPLLPLRGGTAPHRPRPGRTYLDLAGVASLELPA